MEYKVGDRVKIVPCRVGDYWNSEGEMDRWLGKVMTVRAKDADHYHMVEDRLEHCGWEWYPWMIEGIATSVSFSPVNIFKYNKS